MMPGLIRSPTNQVRSSASTPEGGCSSSTRRSRPTVPLLAGPDGFAKRGRTRRSFDKAVSSSETGWSSDRLSTSSKRAPPIGRGSPSQRTSPRKYVEAFENRLTGGSFAELTLKKKKEKANR